MRLVLDFLRELKENNNREWFNNNRKLYENAKEDFETILNKLILAVYSFDPKIGTLTTKECIFRIFRDVRFSKDKSPYKTNFGGFISRGGRKGGYAGYYVHIEPGKSFLGGGIYIPSADMLKALRKEIYYNADEFKRIINDNTFKKYFKNIEGEKLKRPPKDFPPEFPDIDLLKYKSYVVLHEMTDDKLLSERFEEYCTNVFKKMYSLNQFVNRALG